MKASVYRLLLFVKVNSTAIKVWIQRKNLSVCCIKLLVIKKLLLLS